MSYTVTPVKTDSIAVLAHQVATHPTTIVGSAIDVSTKKAISLHLFHGYIEATADTNPGRFLIQVRADDGAGSVNEHWITVAELVALGTTPDDENLTTTESAGDSSLAVASTTGFVAGDLLYIRNVGTLANSEWARLKSIVSNTSLELMDGLTNGMTSSDKVFNDASAWVVNLDVRNIEAIRVVWFHQGATGADGHIKVLGVTHDSDTIV